MMKPIAVPIPEAARLIGVGRSTLYKLIAGKAVDVVHIGRRTLVTVASLTHCVASKTGEAA